MQSSLSELVSKIHSHQNISFQESGSDLYIKEVNTLSLLNTASFFIFPILSQSHIYRYCITKPLLLLYAKLEIHPLVGILNFFNTMITGILARRREFAILQSIGMTSKQLLQMLILEGSYYTLGSAFWAILLCLLAKPLICKAFERMFWFFRSHFTLLPVLALLPFFALLGALIPCAAFRRTGKSSLADRLRECN